MCACGCAYVFDIVVTIIIITVSIYFNLHSFVQYFLRTHPTTGSCYPGSEEPNGAAESWQDGTLELLLLRSRELMGSQICKQVPELTNQFANLH